MHIITNINIQNPTFLNTIRVRIRSMVEFDLGLEIMYN